MKWIVVPLAIAFTFAPVSSGAGGQKHTIKVDFSYDFRVTPACPSKSKGACVQTFVLYDISAGIANRAKLMTVPLPTQRQGLVKDITATTPLLLFEPGRHLIAVVAQTPSGVESTPCTVWVTVP